MIREEHAMYDEDDMEFMDDDGLQAQAAPAASHASTRSFGGPFLCPRYHFFRHVDAKGKETVQYCPATGYAIAGGCGKQDVWFERMCPGCPRMAGITPAPERRRKVKRQEDHEDDIPFDWNGPSEFWDRLRPAR